MAGVHSPAFTASGAAAMRQVLGSVLVRRSQIPSKGSSPPTDTVDHVVVLGWSRTPRCEFGRASAAAQPGVRRIRAGSTMRVGCLGFSDGDDDPVVRGVVRVAKCAVAGSDMHPCIAGGV